MKLIKPFILTILIMVVYSCTNDEILVENFGGQEAVSGAISFEQGFVDNSTRAGIALSDYQQSMGVWGYRNPASDNEMIFKNQNVEFDEELGWKYSPLKYWESASLYDFYAYSPHNRDLVSIDTSLARAYLININNITLTGANLQAVPSSAEKMIFLGSGDTDWMIAREAQKNVAGAAKNTVQFNMQHILSKLNVRMRISAAMESLLGSAYVTVDKIAIGNLYCEGSFAQKLTATPVTDEEKLASAMEWTLTDDEITLQRTDACTLTSTNLYLMESLVMPQVIDAADNIYIEYTIHYADHKEKFKFRKPMRDISSELYHLYTGYNYTLTFLIDPDQITFTANAANWDSLTPNPSPQPGGD